MAANPYSAPMARVADMRSDSGVEVTWGRTLKVWWSLVWRMLVFSMVAGFVAGAIIGGIGAGMGANAQSLSSLGSIAGMVVSLPVGMWVVRSILRKSWSDFRIVLLPK